jgi:hypothetical protein
VDLKVSGFEEVKRMLDEAPKDVALIGFAKALDRASLVIQEAVVQHAEQLPDASDTPLSEHTKTYLEINANLGVGIAEIGFDQSQDERTGIPQDLKAYLVEFGHRMTGHSPKKQFIKDVPPHPFVRPAFDESADRAIEVFGDTLVDSLPFLEKK